MIQKSSGIYIHIPFCIRKCPYCDFYSLADTTLQEAYSAALMRQIRSAPSVAADTVYFGGGTPSLLPAEMLAEILGTCRQVFDLAPDSEITFEMNPATADISKLRALRDAGFNRVSIGIQSTDPMVLSALGRLHTSEEAMAALDQARSAGFENISADLMLATPFSTIDSVGKSIRDLTAAGVTHLSAYLLKIMPGTPFDLNRPSLPSEDDAADQYEFVCGMMRERGYLHYEISNFSIPGCESRHNLKYWRLDDYFGFGPGAHSCVGRARSSIPPDLKKYIELWQTPQPSFDCFSVSEGQVTGEDLIITGLRTAEGIDLEMLRREFGIEMDSGRKERIRLFCNAGLMEQTGSRLCLTEGGFLVSNSILSELI